MGAAFLGSHLCDRCWPEGHEVIGMDNFITGSPENIAHLATNEKFFFYNRDVSNYIFVPGKVDAILHLASPASPNPLSPSGYFNLPIQTMKAGALGTHNCLGIARVLKSRFMLASTSEIYGDPLVHPQVEPIGKCRSCWNTGSL
jgi:dTDP-glucose 4,6-dehydratase